MVEDRDVTDLDPRNLNPILKRWINPVTTEGRHEAIRHGQAGPWDNFHQRPTFAKVDLPADLVDGFAKACVECLHIHWRWGRLAGGDLPGLGGTEPIIPEGSTQDAYVHLIKPRPGEEGMKLERLDDNDRWTPGDPIADGDVAFYWVAGNTQQHDAFFTHWAWAVPRAPATADVAGASSALAVPESVEGYRCPVWWT